MERIEIRNLTKYYGSLCAANEVNFSFSRGKITALCGKNGSGKSTILHCMLGINEYNSGEILCDGNKWNVEMKKVGYLPEERGLFLNDKVSTQLSFLAKLKGMDNDSIKKSMKYWLEKFGIEGVIEKRLGDLSKGNQQKIQIISSLMHDPEVLIWDEPFSGLDPLNMQVLVETLKELKKKNICILISSHQLNLMEDLCEDVCVIDVGEIKYYGSVFDFKQKYGQKFLYFTTKNDIQMNNEIVKTGPYEYRMSILDNEDAICKLRQLLDSDYEVENFGKKTSNLQETFISLIQSGE